MTFDAEPADSNKASTSGFRFLNILLMGASLDTGSDV